MNTDENQDTPGEPADLGHPHRPGLPGRQGSRPPGRRQPRDQVQGRPGEARRRLTVGDRLRANVERSAVERDRAPVRCPHQGLRPDPGRRRPGLRRGRGRLDRPEFPSRARRGTSTPAWPPRSSPPCPVRSPAVGLFVDRPADEVAEVADRLGLRVVQLHGDEPPRGPARPRRTSGSSAPSASATPRRRGDGRLPGARPRRWAGARTPS